MQLRYELDDLQMKIHLLAKLPEEYQVTKKAIQVNGLGKKDIEDIVKDLNQVWKEKGYDKAPSTKEETDVALTVEEAKEKNLRKDQNNNKKKFEKDCGYCGKKIKIKEIVLNCNSKHLNLLELLKWIF